MDLTERGGTPKDGISPQPPPTFKPSSSDVLYNFPRAPSESDDLGTFSPRECNRQTSTPAHQITSATTETPSEAASVGQNPQHTTKPKLVSPSLFLRDLREAIEMGRDALGERYSSLGISPRARAVIGAAALLSAGATFGHDPVLGSGLGALAIWQVAVCYKLNRHGRALSILAQSLYTPHMWALGFNDVAICGLAATGRSLLQAMIPDERPVARGAIAIAGFAATAGVYAFAKDISPILSMENIPLITLGLSSVTGAFTDRFSWASRLTGLTSVGLSLMYHGLVTGSETGLCANTVFMLSAIWSIWKHDITTRSESA